MILILSILFLFLSVHVTIVH